MTIENWEKTGRPWAEGLDILREMEPSSQFLGKFDREGASAWNTAKLLFLLRGLKPREARQSLTRRQAQRTQSAASIPDQAQPMRAAEEQLYPAPIAQAMERRAHLVRRRNQLSNTLRSLATDEDRASTRKEIETLHANIQEYNTYIGTWERTRELGTPPQEVIVLAEKEVAELRQRLTHARNRRNKARHNLKNAQALTDVKIGKKEGLIAQYQAEVNHWTAEVQKIETALTGTIDPT